MSARALDLIRLGGEAIRKISMLFSVSAVEKVRFQSPPHIMLASGLSWRQRRMSAKNVTSTVFGP